ncbi:MAG: HEAT repeat domain-containing protein [Planctomycetes bacterium]|nr:HEAT repeat domain-containing protein [Planctomycetota bacterium]
MRVPLLPWFLLLAACATTSDGKKEEAPKPRAAAPSSATAKREGEKEGIFVDRETEGYGDTRPVPKATDEEIAEFNRIWELFRKGDGAWPRERDRFKRRGDAAGYLLAGHLIRFYMQANMARESSAKALVRAKDEIVAVGAPCAPALIDLMVLDRIPIADGRNFVPDDLTRQDALDMLERMGPQGVPDMLRALSRKDLGIKGRRFLALALGGTKDPRAYDPLAGLLRSDPSWQVRADAATALGRLGDPRAIDPLTEAVRKDADSAVVKRAGKARDDLLKARKQAP